MTAKKLLSCDNSQLVAYFKCNGTYKQNRVGSILAYILFCKLFSINSRCFTRKVIVRGLALFDNRTQIINIFDNFVVEISS